MPRWKVKERRRRRWWMMMINESYKCRIWLSLGSFWTKSILFCRWTWQPRAVLEAKLEVVEALGAKYKKFGNTKETRGWYIMVGGDGLGTTLQFTILVTSFIAYLILRRTRTRQVLKLGKIKVPYLRPSIKLVLEFCKRQVGTSI